MSTSYSTRSLPHIPRYLTVSSPHPCPTPVSHTSLQDVVPRLTNTPLHHLVTKLISMRSSGRFLKSDYSPRTLFYRPHVYRSSALPSSNLPLSFHDCLQRVILGFITISCTPFGSDCALLASAFSPCFFLFLVLCKLLRRVASSILSCSKRFKYK